MKNSFKKLLFTLTAVTASLLLILPSPYYLYPTLQKSSEEAGTKSLTVLKNSSTQSTLRIMSFNLLADYKGFGGGDVKPRAELFKKLAELSSPDVLCLQEESFNWFCAIEKGFENYRQIKPLTCFLGLKMTSVLYNKNTISLIKSGELEYENGDDLRTRRAVYGVFSQQSTGERFVVISTHLSFIRSSSEAHDLAVARSQCANLLQLVKELEAEYACPVITAGDFNSKESSDGKDYSPSCEIYGILNTVFTDAKYEAENIFAEDSEKNSPSNDHIFISGGATVKGFTVISTEPYSEISDHCPIFADIILKEENLP